MFRYLALITVCAVVLAAPLRDALACQCAADAPAVDVEAARRSGFIFEARVVTQTPRDGTSLPFQLELADVKVHRGAAQGTELTLTNGGACAPAPVEIGQRYLFYLGDAAHLHINACSRVVAFPGAQKEIAALSAPSGSPGEQPPPAPVVSAPPATSEAPSLPPRSGSCASCQVGTTESGSGSQGLWLLAAVAALAARSSRR